MPTPIEGALGSRLRHAVELMDGDVAQACADLGLVDHRPRYSPVLRVLVTDGPCSIRELAEAIGVTHSAASQTVAQMRRAGLVALAAGTDARQRIVRLTAKARRLLPAIEAEWAATAAAAAQLDAELPYPLSTLVEALHEALRRRPFRQRIADAAATVSPQTGRFRDALMNVHKGP